MNNNKIRWLFVIGTSLMQLIITMKNTHSSASIEVQVQVLLWNVQVQYQGGYQQYSSQDSLPDYPYSSQSLDSHAGQTTGSMIEIMRMKILAVIDSVDIHKHGILFGQCLFCLVSYPMLPIFLRSFCRHAAIDAELEQNEGRSRWKQPTTFFKSSLWTQSGWIDGSDIIIKWRNWSCVLCLSVGNCPFNLDAEKSLYFPSKTCFQARYTSSDSRLMPPTRTTLGKKIKLGYYKIYWNYPW